jgi:hypothetical protein
MKQYPDVYIPYSFRNVKPQPPSPPIEPSKPVAPIKPTWLNPIIVGLITLGIGLFVFMELPVVALLLGMGTTIFSRLMLNKGYRKDLKLFREVQEKYPALVNQYQEERKQFERMIRELNKPEVIRQYRLKVIKNLRIYQPDSFSSSAKKGRSERILFDCLKKHLKGEFYDKTALNIPNYDYPFSPDIAYKIEGIYIDIEVDEPYYEKDGILYPYHGYDEWQDQNRNEFFVERNWIVIRFSEEQVVKYPESCVKEVAKLVNQLLGEGIPASLVNIADLKPMPRWTSNQAEIMIENNYRNRY